MDTVTKAVRSRIMRSVKSRDTAPELLARRLLRGLYLRPHPRVGFSPDLGSKSGKIAVFVHGCFWHGCPRHFRLPVTNAGFWRAKIARNARRHCFAVSSLKAAGWTVATVWEHELREDAVMQRLRDRFHERRGDGVAHLFHAPKPFTRKDERVRK